LELYAEHGYDNVTITQIAERAGITRRSYFRYFPDKREVLFAGADQLPPAIVNAVLASEGPTALAAALDAVREVGGLLVARAEQTAQRRAVIESSPELQERERTKSAAITAAIAEGLVRRGIAAQEARLVSRLAAVALQEAFERWTDTGEDFASCLDAAAGSIAALYSPER
jgi:AcrR family transcriptional regulator